MGNGGGEFGDLLLDIVSGGRCYALVVPAGESGFSFVVVGRRVVRRLGRVAGCGFGFAYAGRSE